MSRLHPSFGTAMVGPSSIAGTYDGSRRFKRKAGGKLRKAEKRDRKLRRYASMGLNGAGIMGSRKGAAKTIRSRLTGDQAREILDKINVQMDMLRRYPGRGEYTRADRALFKEKRIATKRKKIIPNQNQINARNAFKAIYARRGPRSNRPGPAPPLPPREVYFPSQAEEEEEAVMEMEDRAKRVHFDVDELPGQEKAQGGRKGGAKRRQQSQGGR